MKKSNKFTISKKDLILIIITSLISFAIGYIFWVVDKEPNISFDILSNTEVFSVNTQVENLSVKYGNQDLSKSNKKLVLLTIRYFNGGDQVLLENDYFTRTPLGLKILNGNIADDPEIISASNDVLKEYSKIKRKGLDSLIVNKPPLAVEDFLTFKILAVTDRKSNEIKLESFGSVNGTHKIPINETYRKADVTTQSIWDQTLRIAGYILIGILIIIILYWIFHPRDMNIPMDMENRKIIAERYIKKYPPKDPITNKILEYYVNYGLYPISHYNLSSNLKHFYWNEFPYNSNQKEEFEAMRNFLREIEEMGYLKVNEDDKSISLDNKVQKKLFGTYETISDWHDRMHRGFAFG